MISVFEGEDKIYLFGYIFFKFVVYLPKKRVLGHQQPTEKYHSQVFKFKFSSGLKTLP